MRYVGDHGTGWGAQTHPSFAPVVMPPHVYDGGWEFFVGGGMAVFDCDQDSLPDIFIAGGEAPSALLRNRSQRGGEIKFTKQTPQELSLENETNVELASNPYSILDLTRLLSNA